MSGSIVIVDYGMGNVGSIRNMLRHVGFPSTISATAEAVLGADKLILAGVGAFDSAVSVLRERGLFELLEEAVVARGTPMLGICLGMQLLTRQSEEGKLPGFGWVPGQTVRFHHAAGSGLKVPHMGWNVVEPVGADPLFAGAVGEQRFYFVHSYHVVCDDERDAIGRTPYGYDFVSAVHRGNVWGTQFHPEKSHRYGMRVLKNYAEWTPA